MCYQAWWYGSFSYYIFQKQGSSIAKSKPLGTFTNMFFEPMGTIITFDNHVSSIQFATICVCPKRTRNIAQLFGCIPWDHMSITLI